MKLGGGKVSQGAEERSSLLSKLLFSRYTGSHKVGFTTQQATLLTIHWQPKGQLYYFSKLLFSRYTGSHKVGYTTQQAALLKIHWQP
jgi:hypothetical protein